MIKEYHKIDSIYERDERGRFTSKFASPEFEYLFNNTWVGTEKFHGMNMRIDLKADGVLVQEIGGKTDNAQIPTHLLKRINELIASEPFKQFGLKAEDATNITFYGEGFGHRINKGDLYLGDQVDFILFDVLIDRWWLKREAVTSIANELSILSVPVVFEGNLTEAMDMAKAGFKSTVGTAEAEGLVLTPKVDLFCRNGDRIITKIKYKDFKHLR